jgi:hypothetical protein
MTQTASEETPMSTTPTNTEGWEATDRLEHQRLRQRVDSAIDHLHIVEDELEDLLGELLRELQHSEPPHDVEHGP